MCQVSSHSDQGLSFYRANLLTNKQTNLHHDKAIATYGTHRRTTSVHIIMKKRSEATQTLRAGCSKAEPQTNKHIGLQTHKQTGAITIHCAVARSVIKNNKLCGKPRNMPRPSTQHAAAQLQPIHALRLWRPAHLAP